jgi:hypothetical protein
METSLFFALKFYKSPYIRDFQKKEAADSGYSGEKNPEQNGTEGADGSKKAVCSGKQDGVENKNSHGQTAESDNWAGNLLIQPYTKQEGKKQNVPEDG